MARDFRPAVERFLAAVARRDRATFLEYFNPELEFYALLPDQREFKDLPSFLRSQDPWFADTKGRFVYEVTLATEAGVALVDVVYDDFSSGGTTFRLRIAIRFVFRPVGERWYLVDDRNVVLSRERF